MILDLCPWEEPLRPYPTQLSFGWAGDGEWATQFAPNLSTRTLSGPGYGNPKGRLGSEQKRLGKEGSGSLKELRLDQWTLKQVFDSQGEFPFPAFLFLVILQVTKHLKLRGAEGRGLKAPGQAERDLFAPHLHGLRKAWYLVGSRNGWNKGKADFILVDGFPQ